MMYKHTFTVFTPTYNRAHTLHRVYKSLEAQTYRSFEWLIVDDGSVDDTRRLASRWQKEANFPIRYIWQANAGKHIAVNRGVTEALGELFLNIDSDNGCLPVALERFKFHWDSIPKTQKEEFSGVSCLSQDPKGRIIGTRFPFNPTDSNTLEIRLKYNVKGEKWGFHRIEVMRKFPYPHFDGETSLADSLVWNRIAQRYKTRYVNELLQIYFVAPNSWSSNQRKIRAKNSRGATLYFKELIDIEYPVPKNMLLRYYANYIRFSLHAGIGVGGQVRDVRSNFYWVSALPIGYMVYLRDKILNLL